MFPSAVITDLWDNLDDWPRYFVIADMIAEHGDERMAFTFRWMGSHKKHPYYRPKAKVVPWLWCKEKRFDPRRNDIYPEETRAEVDRYNAMPEVLPDLLFMCLEQEDHRIQYAYKTLDDAIGDLKEALNSLRIIVEVRPWNES